MDVSDSSEESIGNELSKYLKKVVVSLKEWTGKDMPIHVSHRAGDELVVISRGYATAYILAFYLSRIWKYTEHKPYFGLSFGDIDDDFHTLNIETWIHPLMKHARLANEFLKQQQNRGQFRFVLPDSSKNTGYEIFNRQFETLFNTSLLLKQEQINEQTAIQSLVCSLYLMLAQQNKVSQYLGRTRSTVSSHMKNGKTEVILNTFNDIVQVLNSLEVSDGEGQTNELQDSMRKKITKHLHDYFPLERSQ